MNFEESLKEFAGRVEELKNSITNEEATKTSLIMPLFRILGYDIFDPTEFMPEFTADVGIKKKEKVDYAIIRDGEPVILIEAKSVKENLDKHGAQLFRYFSTTNARFGILTNGIIYRFYTDLQKANQMDLEHFLEINLLSLKDSHLQELKKFHKAVFDLESVMNTASTLKDINKIKAVLEKEISEPSDNFIRLVLSQGIYTGTKTANIVEKYNPIVKRCWQSLINDIVNNRLKGAMTNEEEPPELEDNIIVTTPDEIEAYFIVKSILRDAVDAKRITYKDTLSYFAILVDGKVTRWVCRAHLKESVMYITIPNEDGEIIRYDISNLDEIFMLSDCLLKRLSEVK